MFGIVGDLEGVAGIVGGEIGDEDERLSGALLLVVHGDTVRFDFRHVNLPLRMSYADVAGRNTYRRAKRQTRRTCLQQVATRDSF